MRTTRGVYWYGDDDSSVDIRKGGTGRQTRVEGDGFQLTVYDRAFTTPSWLQGAFVYEIFPDRFRNGDPTRRRRRPITTCTHSYVRPVRSSRWSSC